MLRRCRKRQQALRSRAAMINIRSKVFFMLFHRHSSTAVIFINSHSKQHQQSAHTHTPKGARHCTCIHEYNFYGAECCCCCCSLCCSTHCSGEKISFFFLFAKDENSHMVRIKMSWTHGIPALKYFVWSMLKMIRCSARKHDEHIHTHTHTRVAIEIQIGINVVEEQPMQQQQQTGIANE